MTRTRAVIAALALIAIVSVLPARADAMTFRQGDKDGNVTIPPGETIRDDLYVAGNDVIVSGDVDGSLFAVGSNITVEGSVTGDVFAAGNSVTVRSGVGRGIRVAGNAVTVNGTAAEDILAAGSNVSLGPASSAGRDVAVAGTRVSIAGKIARDLFANGNDVRLTGSVGGNLLGDMARFRIAEGARVTGDVSYTSPNDADIAEGTVGGKVARSKPVSEQPTAAAAIIAALVAWLRRMVGLFLFGAVLVLLLPVLMRRASERITASPLPSAGLGFAVLAGAPVAALMLFVVGLVVGGWWIGLMLLAVYWIAVAAATVVSALFAGRWIMRVLSRPAAPEVLALLVGLLALTALEAIPVLGVLVRIVEVVFGLGALALAWVRPEPPATTVTTETGAAPV